MTAPTAAQMAEGDGVARLRAIVAKHRTYEALSAAYAAEEEAAQAFRNEVAERRQLKGPPKGNQNSPHWWHTLVYRLEQQIDSRDAELKRLREALEAENARLRELLDIERTVSASLASQGLVMPGSVEYRDPQAEATTRRLREALVKVRAHTSYAGPGDSELLRGLLASIERITDAALAGTGVTTS